jgi:hypothetical protein
MMTRSDSSFWRRPVTRLGWWAVGLLIAYVVMSVINSAVFMRLAEAPWQHIVLPFYGILMLLCGLAAGIVGLIALIRKQERSWLVWLSLLPGVSVLFLLLGEFLIPH